MSGEGGGTWRMFFSEKQHSVNNDTERGVQETSWPTSGTESWKFWFHPSEGEPKNLRF